MYVCKAAVGTAVICENGDDVFGFATILTQSSYSIQSPIHTLLCELTRLLDAKPNTHALRTALQDLKTLGVFIHRRYANFPIQLISLLHKVIYMFVCL